MIRKLGIGTIAVFVRALALLALQHYLAHQTLAKQGGKTVFTWNVDEPVKPKQSAQRQ